MNPPIQSQKTTILPLLIALTLACFALSPTARAVTPAPDGGYPNFNTAEGDNALFSLDTSQGVNNTAIGFQALFSNTTGYAHTANAASALFRSQKTTILPLLIALTLACFALSPTARAVTPAPDGGYPNFNTAEGDNALFSLDTSQGVNNTAIGFQALFSNTTGSTNTAGAA